jgi:predicted permease
MLQDIRFGLRGLRLNPGFTALAVLTLALGLGACLAIFSILNGVLLRPLPYPHPERIVSLLEVNGKGNDVRATYPNFVDWRAQSRSFDAMAAYSGGESPVLLGRRSVRALTFLATSDFFQVLGVPPMMGRTFGEADTQGATTVAVVSYAFWRDVLGSPRELAGHTLTVDAYACEVIGVMPPDFAFPASAAVWMPASKDEDWGTRTAHNATVVGRLKADVAPAAAQQELHAIATRLKAAYTKNDAISVHLIDLRDRLVGRTRTPLYLLMGAVLLVLLTACANLAATLLARATQRQREMAIRASLGADRWRLLRQLLAESLVLAGLGGACGLIVARLVLPALLALAPASLPRIDEVQIDGVVTLVGLGLALLTCLLVGLAPAVQASRVDLRTVMADTSRGTTAHRSARTRASLVSAEVAVAFVLLVGAGLLIKSLSSVLDQPLGFNPSHVLTVDVALPSARYDGATHAPQLAAFYDRLLEATRVLPGVQEAGLTRSLPLRDTANGTFAVADSQEQFGDALYRVVDRGFFTTLQIPLLAGRLFDDGDRERDGVHAAVINKTLADRFWPGQSPLGKRLRPLGMDSYGPIWLTVVGLVGDTKADSLTNPAYPEIFVFYRQRPSSTRYATLLVRTKGDPEAQVNAIRALLKNLEPEAPPKFQTYEAQIAKTAAVADRAFLMTVLGAFSGLALLLTAVGIYGVLAYAVAQRTQEIGIRMALGATRRAVIALVFRHAFMSVAAGLAVGLLGAWLLTGALRSVLFDVRPTDPLVLVATVLLIIATTALAGYVPAWRATRVDPQVAMRAD